MTKCCHTSAAYTVTHNKMSSWYFTYQSPTRVNFNSSTRYVVTKLSDSSSDTTAPVPKHTNTNKKHFKLFWQIIIFLFYVSCCNLAICKEWRWRLIPSNISCSMTVKNPVEMSWLKVISHLITLIYFWFTTDSIANIIYSKGPRWNVLTGGHLPLDILRGTFLREFHIDTFLKCVDIIITRTRMTLKIKIIDENKLFFYFYFTSTH